MLTIYCLPICVYLVLTVFIKLGTIVRKLTVSACNTFEWLKKHPVFKTKLIGNNAEASRVNRNTL